MRRIIAVLCVMALMAAMVVVLAMPAFAKTNCDQEGTILTCRGGSGGGGGGSGGGYGGIFIADYSTFQHANTGGVGFGGGGEGGGEGGNCTKGSLKGNGSNCN